jgi:hypothetical protein
MTGFGCAVLRKSLKGCRAAFVTARRRLGLYAIDDKCQWSRGAPENAMSAGELH